MVRACKEAYAELTVRESRLRNVVEASTIVSVLSTTPAKLSGKYFYCESPRYIFRKCRRKNADNERRDNKERGGCFRCGVVG